MLDAGVPVGRQRSAGTPVALLRTSCQPSSSRRDLVTVSTPGDQPSPAELAALVGGTDGRGEGRAGGRRRRLVHHRDPADRAAGDGDVRRPRRGARHRRDPRRHRGLVPRAERACRDLGPGSAGPGGDPVRRRGPPPRRRRGAGPAGEPAAHPGRRPPFRVLLGGSAAHRRTRLCVGDPRPSAAESGCAPSTSPRTTQRPIAPATWPGSTSGRLREVYLAPFERLVADGAWTVMAAYSGLDDGTRRGPGHRTWPAAARNPQGGVGFRRRGGQRLARHQVGRARRACRPGSADARAGRPVGRRTCRLPSPPAR